MMYPIQSTKPEIAEHEMLAVAAAFEGMHHWEHERRLAGNPMRRDAAGSSLAAAVTDEINSILPDVNDGLCYPKLVEEVVGNTTAQALNLYDRQYGDDEWYDPGRVEPHETMKEEWHSPLKTRKRLEI